MGCVSKVKFGFPRDMLGEEAEESLLFADGFEEALMGYVEQVNRPLVALYDQDKCIEILQQRDGMSLDCAREYFDFNVMGGGAGEYTPAFATIIRQT